MCPVCGKEFPSKAKFRTHYMIHTGEKPFACSFCDYKAIQASDVRKHIRYKHSDISSWCLLPSMPREFTLLNGPRLDRFCSLLRLILMYFYKARHACSLLTRGTLHKKRARRLQFSIWIFTSEKIREHLTVSFKLKNRIQKYVAGFLIVFTEIQLLQNNSAFLLLEFNHFCFQILNKIICKLYIKRIFTILNDIFFITPLIYILLNGSIEHIFYVSPRLARIWRTINRVAIPFGWHKIPSLARVGALYPSTACPTTFLLVTRIWDTLVLCASKSSAIRRTSDATIWSTVGRSPSPVLDVLTDQTGRHQSVSIIE